MGKLRTSHIIQAEIQKLENRYAILFGRSHLKGLSPIKLRLDELKLELKRMPLPESQEGGELGILLNDKNSFIGKRFDEDNSGFKTESRSNGPIPMPSETVTIPSETMSVPSETMSMPGETMSIPVETISMPGETLTMPGETVTMSSETLQKKETTEFLPRVMETPFSFSCPDCSTKLMAYKNLDDSTLIRCDNGHMFTKQEIILKISEKIASSFEISPESEAAIV